MTVVDAGVLCHALVGGPRDDVSLLRRRLTGDLAAPAHVDLEVCSTVRRYVRAGSVGATSAALAIDRLASMPLRRHFLPPLLPRVWELRHNLTPYDAAYVALAEATGSVLLTSDRRLATAPGPRCAIEVWAVPPDL